MPRNQLDYGRKAPTEVNWMRVLAFAACAAAAIIAIALLLNLPDHRHPPTSSAMRLRLIGDEAFCYALDRPDRRFPESFEALVASNGIYLRPDLFASPKGPATPAPDYETMFREPGHISYVWIGTGLTLDNITADTPLLYEGPVTDFEAGTLVFFGDFSVNLVKGDDLRKLLNEAGERRKQATTLPATRPATRAMTAEGS